MSAKSHFKYAAALWLLIFGVIGLTGGMGYAFFKIVGGIK